MMRKSDPIITYDHIRDDVRLEHPKSPVFNTTWEKFSFIAESILILLLLTSIILLVL